MNLIPIESRLRLISIDGSPLFSAVKSALDPATVIENGIVKSDCAFVIPMAESASSNERTTGIYSQEITMSFGIMIGVRASNDRLGSNVNDRLDTIKKAVRESMLGWDLNDSETYDEIEFIQGELISFLKGGAFWMEQYQTNYLYEQGSP